MKTMIAESKLVCTLLLALSTAGAASATDYTITTAGNWSTATWTPSKPATAGGTDVAILTGKTGDNTYNNDMGTGSPAEFLLNSLVWYLGSPQLKGNQLGFVPNGATQPSIVYNSQNTPLWAFGITNNIRIQDGATLTINGNGADARGTSVATGYQLRGVISGAADVVINGTSAQDNDRDYVMFTAANTYSGTTTLNSGVLQFGDGTSGNNGTIANSLSLVNYGSLIYNLSGSVTYGGVISGSGTLTKAGGSGSTLVLTGVSTYSGTTTISAGTLRLGNGNSGKDGRIDNSLSIVNAGTLEFRRFGSRSYGGVISGAGEVIKSGNGTQTLSGANSYQGATTVSVGILNIQHDAALGAALGDAASGTTVADGATLQLEGGITVGSERLTVDGVGATGENGALVNVSGNNTWGGQLRMGTTVKTAADGGTLLIDNGTANVLQVTDSDLTFTMEAADGAAIQLGTGDENIGIDNTKTNLTFIMTGAGSGAVLTEILGGGGTGTLIKDGAGTWGLNRTYAASRGWRGELQINSGTLALGAADAISYLDSRNIVRVNDGGTLDLGGNNTTIVGLGNAGGNTSGLVTNSSTGTCTLTVGELDVTSTFEGRIQDGAGAIGLSKTGTGTFTLEGANAFSGDTTVSAGTLIVNGSIGSSAVTVEADGTLGGNGTVGGVATVNGTAAPGTSIGTLTFNSAPTLNGLTLMEINKGASPNADKLVVSSGTLTLGGTLTVNNVGNALTGGEVFDLFDAGTITGAFSGSPNLPSLDEGLNWWTGNLAVDGTIKVNRAPSGGADALTTRTNVPVTVTVVKLMQNDTDGDNDTLSITGVGNALPSGASVALDSGEVTYTPQADSEEAGSFEYTLDDGHGGVVAVTVSVTVTGNSGGGSPNVVYGPVKDGDEFVVRFAGIPGYEYTVESSATPTGGWTKKENKTAPTDNSAGFGIGVFEVRDTTEEASRYYRTVYPSY